MQNLIKGVNYLNVKIHPIAQKSEIKGEMSDGTLKIDIAAIPQQGRANKELINFLSREFKIPTQNISIEQGFTSSRKLVRIVT
ncbi:MAG: hypothetical protein UT33_C0007G0017 [Candidatus Peregrinibacteria bacterium GW2011_GWC2_39_14]|nr:MAG: hypothetical protein US92_C0002G0018 [Candidatus Peregrinibacteria bacterium GW2011_GWA2_38_36]KKR06829.1 MAG: hypothetical protein UT33_C0007G0017 [Candidatus Peregrinibacteria bacterium GW2011_GWC2_39_14]